MTCRDAEVEPETAQSAEPLAAMSPGVIYTVCNQLFANPAHDEAWCPRPVSGSLSRSSRVARRAGASSFRICRLLARTLTLPASSLSEARECSTTNEKKADAPRLDPSRKPQPASRASTK